MDQQLIIIKLQNLQKWMLWTIMTFMEEVATWLDFFMLAEAKVIVHSESSFSINAAFLKPIPHSFHSWVMYDNDKGCLASYISGNTTCIC